METNKIYNEDCMLTMENRIDSKSVDCVFTSPPYNLTKESISGTDRKKGLRYDEYNDELTEDEYLLFTEKLFNYYDKILNDTGCIIYNMSYGKSNPNLMNLTIAHIIKNTSFGIQDIIVWKKPVSMPNPASNALLQRICEFVYVFVKDSHKDKFQMNKQIVKTLENGMNYFEAFDNFVEAANNDGANDLNKATFSTEFARKILRMYIPKGKIVYDSFMGTGTTAKACIIDDYKYIGSELSKKQIEYSDKRLKPYLTQTTLF